MDQATWIKDSFDSDRTPLFADYRSEKGPLYRFAFGAHRSESVVLEADQGSANELLSGNKSLKELGFGSFEKSDLDSFFKVDRNYLVMTTAGKPVFAL